MVCLRLARGIIVISEQSSNHKGQRTPDRKPLRNGMACTHEVFKSTTLLEPTAKHKHTNLIEKRTWMGVRGEGRGRGAAEREGVMKVVHAGLG